MEKEIKELQALLKKGYDHYFENSDGYHKSSEGLIEVVTCYDNMFGAKPEYVGSKPIYFMVKVYSYVLGPSRMHEFDGKTFEEAYKKAYEAVTGWVEDELKS